MNVVLTDADSDGGEENAVVKGNHIPILFQLFSWICCPWHAAIRATGMWRGCVVIVAAKHAFVLKTMQNETA